MISSFQPGTEGDPVLSLCDRPDASSSDLGDQSACSGDYYLQHPDYLPMEGLSSASTPFGIKRSPDDLSIPMLSYGPGYKGDLSTGPPVAYNRSHLSYPPRIEPSPSVDAKDEWMPLLEKIPIHDPARNISPGQPNHPETGDFPQTVVMANEIPLCISPTEQPFHGLVVNTPLPSPCINDPRFTGRVENTTPSLMSFSQNDHGLGDFIASMDGSLSTETPESYQYSDTLFGTLFHSWERSVS